MESDSYVQVESAARRIVKVPVQLVRKLSALSMFEDSALTILLAALARLYGEKERANSCSYTAGLTVELEPIASEGYGSPAENEARAALKDLQSDEQLDYALQRVILDIVEGGNRYDTYEPTGAQMTSAYLVAMVHGHGWTDHWDTINKWSQIVHANSSRSGRMLSLGTIEALVTPLEDGMCLHTNPVRPKDGGCVISDSTGSNRLSWEVDEGGSVEFTIRRPGQNGDGVSVLRVKASSDGKVLFLERFNSWKDIGSRHIRPLVQPILALRQLESSDLAYGGLFRELVGMLSDEVEQARILGEFEVEQLEYAARRAGGRQY